MVKLLQINLNHCWAAQQLLRQTVRELSVDVILVSDQLRNPQDDNWIPSQDNKCAVAVVGNFCSPVESRGNGKGFAWARLGEIVYYSCYWTPNCTLDEFSEFLGQLDASM